MTPHPAGIGLNFRPCSVSIENFKALINLNISRRGTAVRNIKINLLSELGLGALHNSRVIYVHWTVCLIFLKFWKSTKKYYKIREFFSYCFIMYTKRKFSQIEQQLEVKIEDSLKNLKCAPKKYCKTAYLYFWDGLLIVFITCLFCVSLCLAIFLDKIKI